MKFLTRTYILVGIKEKPWTSSPPSTSPTKTYKSEINSKSINLNYHINVVLRYSDIHKWRSASQKYICVKILPTTYCFFSFFMGTLLYLIAENVHN